MTGDSVGERASADRPPLEDMTLDELREEYVALQQGIAEGEIRALDDEGLWERAPDIWDELRERTDVEQPECPECGARDWGQSPGNPKHCRDCDSELGPGVGGDLREAIDDAWGRIMGDGDAE